MSAAKMTQRYYGRVRLLVRVLVVLCLVCGLAMALLPTWFWHPLASQVCHATYKTPAQVRDCLSYNAWSGAFGSWLSNLPQWIIAGMLLWFHHNCHTPGCFGWARKGKVKCKACERDEPR